MEQPNDDCLGNKLIMAFSVSMVSELRRAPTFKGGVLQFILTKGSWAVLALALQGPTGSSPTSGLYKGSDKDKTPSYSWFPNLRGKEMSGNRGKLSNRVLSDFKIRSFALNSE